MKLCFFVAYISKKKQTNNFFITYFVLACKDFGVTGKGVVAILVPLASRDWFCPFIKRTALIISGDAILISVWDVTWAVRGSWG